MPHALLAPSVLTQLKNAPVLGFLYLAQAGLQRIKFVCVLNAQPRRASGTGAFQQLCQAYWPDPSPGETGGPGDGKGRVLSCHEAQCSAAIKGIRNPSYQFNKNTCKLCKLPQNDITPSETLTPRGWAICGWWRCQCA